MTLDIFIIYYILSSIEISTNQMLPQCIVYHLLNVNRITMLVIRPGGSALHDNL